MRKPLTFLVFIAVLFFAGSHFGTAEWVESKLVQDFGSVDYKDSSVLCRDLLENFDNSRQLDDLKRKTKEEIDKMQAIFGTCKVREEIADLSRKYKESQTMLGRISSASGLLFTFSTAIATLWLAYLGARWTTDRSSAEKRQIEQKRKIDRNEYDFKLFEALSNPASHLGRMAASSALRARINEIEREIRLLGNRWSLGFLGSPAASLGFVAANLEIEKQTIIRVFLSTLKVSQVRNKMAVGTAATASQVVLPDGEALNKTATKAIAEEIAESLGCFLPSGTKPLEFVAATPLKGYDLQRLDLRGVYWGTKEANNYLNDPGRGALNARGLDFFECDFSDASLRGAFLDGIILYSATLRNVVFRDAQLTNAVFDNAVVVGCDFRGANITGCDFKKCAEFAENRFE